MTVTEDRIDLNGSRNTSHFENESWIEKPWKKFEKVVFRLQRRIYKASQKGNFRKDKKLQRLLLKCRSAKYLVDWSLNSAMNYLSGLLSYDYNRAGHSFEPGDESCAVGSLSSLR